jgi:hypothetical protein
MEYDNLQIKNTYMDKQHNLCYNMAKRKTTHVFKQYIWADDLVLILEMETDKCIVKC